MSYPPLISNNHFLTILSIILSFIIFSFIFVAVTTFIRLMGKQKKKLTSECVRFYISALYSTIVLCFTVVLVVQVQHTEQSCCWSESGPISFPLPPICKVSTTEKLDRSSLPDSWQLLSTHKQAAKTFLPVKSNSKGTYKLFSLCYIFVC